MAQSEVRSNVMDTFEGGALQKNLEEVVSLLLTAFETMPDENTVQFTPIVDGDGPLLDACWIALQNIKGFGAIRNLPDNETCSGFILKNVVAQGLRCILRSLGVSPSPVSFFVSGPNPRKLVSLAMGVTHPTRAQQLKFYNHVLQTLQSCSVSYRSRDVQMGFLDNVIVQDFLCKNMEVLISGCTARLCGKGRQTLFPDYVDTSHLVPSECLEMD